MCYMTSCRVTVFEDIILTVEQSVLTAECHHSKIEH